ncbi:hypothetical protein AWW67_01295 [Roseivirga seohaensis]|uniref:Microcin J25-processing protein McjB C-terminal domain-containing protein n=1 Tax=Roseivirga seohaensis TaxID=1914963 RepID=A0A150Y139_9BACT|nr:lasso peptide biosynthesis B2 protein [Roseivirga seohaensis]KYG84707.1 hypothetical protein AWW67_01295 [Roseivirga seohaensis]
MIPISLHKLISIRKKDILLYAVVLITLGFSRLCILIIPFRIIITWIGQVDKETPLDSSSNQINFVNRLKTIIIRVSNNTPWESSCLIQALCAHWLLRLKSIAHTTYIGVRLNKMNLLESHAWVRTGNTIVTGEIDHQEYSVVGKLGYFKQAIH